jgi:hypothetical protein
VNVLTAPPLIGRGHPGINISRLEINGDLGGFVFTTGIVIALAIGLPEARALLGGGIAGGLLVALWLHRIAGRHDGHL